MHEARCKYISIVVVVMRACTMRADRADPSCGFRQFVVSNAKDAHVENDAAAERESWDEYDSSRKCS